MYRREPVRGVGIGADNGLCAAPGGDTIRIYMGGGGAGGF